MRGNRGQRKVVWRDTIKLNKVYSRREILKLRDKKRVLRNEKIIEKIEKSSRNAKENDWTSE